MSQDPSVGLRCNGWLAEDLFTFTVSYHSETGDRFLLRGREHELDRLLVDHVSATDEAPCIALLEQLQDHIIDEAYAIPLL